MTHNFVHILYLLTCLHKEDSNQTAHPGCLISLRCLHCYGLASYLSLSAYSISDNCVRVSTVWLSRKGIRFLSVQTWFESYDRREMFSAILNFFVTTFMSSDEPEESLHHWLSKMRSVKIQIRLRVCAV